MFAMTSGTTNRPKTIPVTREALNDYREGWTIWGIQAFDAHPDMIEKGLRPILQIASDWRESYTAGGIPCGAITGLTASMQSRMVRTTYCMPACASRIKDVESKYYVALRFSVARDLGTVIAANPSTILGMVRLGDREREYFDSRPFRRHARPASGQSPTRSADSFASRPASVVRDASRRLEAIVERDRPALCPATTGRTLNSSPTGWEGRCGPTFAGIPNSSATSRSATSG